MTLTAGEIQRLHASFGRVEDIVERRRAIYRSTLVLACTRASTHPDDLLAPTVVDNPAVRAHLADVLGGTDELDLRRVRALDDLIVVSAEGPLETHVRLASGPDTARALRGALERLGDDLDQPDLRVGPEALVLAGSDRFDSVVRTVTEGIELARDSAPELVDDLIPHVALLAVVNAEVAGGLGSASVREFPGLVLLPEPESPVEVAEALVHEGAHQKFFDLAITRDLLATPPAERFSPPWSAERSSWPFEQCVAAFHAYCCLSAFADRIADDVRLHHYSLLPVARERAEILGRWLAEHGVHFGVDGQAFVGGLCRSEFAIPPASSGVAEALAEMASTSEPVARQQCGDRTLVMQLTRPALLLWMPSEVANAVPIDNVVTNGGVHS
jgi:hypothetical protein